MALAGGASNVPFIHQGASLHCWLTAIEMLMSYRHGTKYGREYTIAADRTVVWGEHRSQHSETARRQLGILGIRRSGCSLAAGSSLELHAQDYGLIAVDRLSSANIEQWRTELRNGPVLGEGTFGPARVIGGHVVLFVGWSTSGKLVYQDPFLGRASSKYSYLTAEDVRNRTLSARNTCYWASL